MNHKGSSDKARPSLDLLAFFRHFFVAVAVLFGQSGPALAERFNPTDDAFVQRYLKPSEYIPVSEIKPGMEGYGLTVFQGTKIERFNVKVIGIIRKALSGRDAILVRLSGEKLGKNNVVRGMSGSPIYLDGRLCGALSYGFDFSKEPIVGVTPVVDMLDALSFHEEERSRNRVTLLKRLPYIEAPAASLMIPNTVPVAGGTLRLTPLMAPVSLSGFSTRAQAFLKDKFNDIGLAISSGGTGALDPSLITEASAHSHGKVAPGSSVAVMLTTGDFASAATGTATASFGNKVVAFGHSFMEGGAVSLPLATAYILEILPSLSVSFKLSSPLQVIGSIFADRPWSVGAEVGKFASMVPIDIVVADEGRGVRKEFHSRVVNHPQLTPDLITASIMSSMDSTYQSQAPYVVKAETDIEIKDHAPVKRTDRFSVNFAAHSSYADSLSRMRASGEPVSNYVGGLVDRLISNDFERAQVSAVKVNLTVEDGRKVTKIERLTLDRSVVAPGDQVRANCLMRPYNGKPFTKQITFQIPRDVPDCDLAIAACGGDELDSLRKRLGISDPTPETLNQIIKRIEVKGRGDALCAVLALPQQSILQNGQIIKSPPAQWTKLFFTDRSTRTPSLVRSDETFREITDNIIDGCHIIAVSVKRTDKVMSKPLPYTVPASASHPSDGVYMTEQARKALEIVHKTDSTAATATAPAAQAAAAPAEAAAAKLPSMWSVASAFPHMRGIRLWRQDAEEHFRGAKLDGVQVDSWGRLSPGFRELARVYPDPDSDQRVWAGVCHKGNFYYSSGNKVYRWSGAANETPQVVAQTEGLIVPALACDQSRSILYFAAAPGEKVYALNLSGGPPRSVARIEGGTVTSLAVADNGTVYIGAAGTGRLYQLRQGQGQAELVFDSGQAHISALWYCQRENRLYVGTAEKGCVYSLSCASTSLPAAVKAEYETGEHIVTGMARDNAGNLYVATAGAGKLLRVEVNGEAEPIALSEAFYRLYYDPREDRVYSGDGEGDVTRVEIEALNGQAYFLPVCHTEQEAVLAVATDDSGRLFCGTANVAQLRCFEIAPGSEPTMQSLVLDGLRHCQWSRLRLADLYNTDKGSFSRSIKVETRGGDTSQPDSSWTPWVVAEPDDDGFAVKTQAMRYLQYRLTWKASAADKDAVRRREQLVSRVDVTYMPTNLAPAFTSLSVKSGDALAGKSAITVVGNDPDADNLKLDLALSADGGKTWKAVASDLRSRSTDKSREKDKPRVDRAREKDKDKDKEKAKDREKAAEPASAPAAGDKEKKASEKGSEKGSEKDRGAEPEKGKLQEAPSAAEGTAKAEDGDAEKKATEASGDMSKEKLSDKDKNPEKGKARGDTAEPAKVAEAYSQSEKIIYSFDTKKEKDGEYVLRFVLSDKPSNAVSEEAATVFRSITIDNGEPRIDNLAVKKFGSGKVTLRLTAHDDVSDISDCLYKIDEGESFALSPAGAPLTDARQAVFEGNNVQYDGQGRKLTVQVFDRAGNSAKKTVNLP
ncbi:MAG: hypothetical protein JSS83_03175 [Cyanobacteria bacterium SZAS LIN-3]|nr:hypothetical protein [Cyanobacteria bacterium SZAS LIN-3]